MPANRGSWGNAVVATFGVLTLVLLAGMCARVADRGRFFSDYSSHGAGPQGARGLYLLAEEEGWAPQRWTQELTALPEAGTLVALGGCASRSHQELGRFERESLDTFVQGGGTLIVAGAFDYLDKGWLVSLRAPERCFDVAQWVRELVDRAAETDDSEDEPNDNVGETGVPPIKLPPGAPEVEPQLAIGQGLLEGLEVPLLQPGTVHVEAGLTHDVLLSVNEEPTAVVVPYGDGQLVVLASGSPFVNASLVSEHGAALFARLMQHYHKEGPLLFDELHVGVGQRRTSVQYFRSLQLGWVALQLLLIFIAVVARAGVRFGALREPLAPLPGGTAPYLAAMGTLYARSRDPQGALRRLIQHAIQRICQRHHLEPMTLDALAAYFTERGPTDAKQTVQRLQVIASRVESGLIENEARTAQELDSLARTEMR